MKVALIRCRVETGARETNVTGIYPPLGLACLAAALRARAHDVCILDAEALGLGSKEALDAIPADAGVIGFTATTLLWPTVRNISFEARRRFPGRLLVAGGPHVTAFPRECLAGSAFDAGVMGDGEDAICGLVGQWAARRAVAGVPGCAVREGERITVNGGPQAIQDLDRLPLPALDLLPMDRYRSVMVRMPFSTIVTSRGCPFRCAFCSQVYTDWQWNTRTPAGIVEEMERNVRQFGSREIILFDETFGVKRGDALEVCRLIVERNLKVRWNARSRVDVLDEALLRAMWGAGCRALHLGVESGSQRVLDMMRKKITLRQVECAAEAARRIGFTLHGYFMLGYPGETRQEMLETIRFARRLPLDWASFTVAVPQPMTPLFELACEQGLMSRDYWQEYTLGRCAAPAPFFAGPDLGPGGLTRMKNMAYLRFYLRPRTLARDLAFLARAGGLGRPLSAGWYWLRELLR